jgi:hypothetical protein
VEDCEADDFIALVADDDIVVDQFAISGAARFFEVDIQDVSLWVIGRPEVAGRRMPYSREEPDVLRDVY